MEYYALTNDKVIDGYVVSGVTNYRYALDNFLPLIGRLDMQRDPLKTKFYSRLQKDIVSGCVMPPVTIALMHYFNEDATPAEIYNYININIKEAFILDGIQRLSTLERASHDLGFNEERIIHVNFVLTKSRDRLLYRMITLNNGQRPMSARHQIDILADAFFDFSEIDLKLVSEKGNGRVRAPDSFKKADFVKGYIAFLSESVSIDNQKIIEEKMDELIASKIIDSNITSSKIEFYEVVDIINRISKNDSIRDWIRNQNNFIGFCVGIKKSPLSLINEDVEDFDNAIKRFEKAFQSINVSKVNIGKVRRETVSKFIANYEECKELDEFNLLDMISDWI